MQNKLKIPYILNLHNGVDLFNFNEAISLLLCPKLYLALYPLDTSATKYCQLHI